MEILQQFLGEHQTAILSVIGGIAAWLNKDKLKKVIPTPKPTPAPEPQDADVAVMLAIKKIIAHAEATGNEKLRKCAQESLTHLFAPSPTA